MGNLFKEEKPHKQLTVFKHTVSKNVRVQENSVQFRLSLSVESSQQFRNNLRELFVLSFFFSFFFEIGVSSIA